MSARVVTLPTRSTSRCSAPSSPGGGRAPVIDATDRFARNAIHDVADLKGTWLERCDPYVMPAETWNRMVKQARARREAAAGYRRWLAAHRRITVDAPTAGRFETYRARLGLDPSQALDRLLTLAERRAPPGDAPTPAQGPAPGGVRSPLRLCS